MRRNTSLGSSPTCYSCQCSPTYSRYMPCATCMTSLGVTDQPPLELRHSQPTRKTKPRSKGTIKYLEPTLCSSGWSPTSFTTSWFTNLSTTRLKMADSAISKCSQCCWLVWYSSDSSLLQFTFLDGSLSTAVSKTTVWMSRIWTRTSRKSRIGVATMVISLQMMSRLRRRSILYLRPMKRR